MDNPIGAAKLSLPSWLAPLVPDAIENRIEALGSVFTGGEGPGLAAVRNILPGTLPRDTDGTIDYNPFPDADDLPAQTTGGDPVNGCNLQVMVQPQAKMIHKAPRGYVIVEHPQTRQKVAMLKSVARSCGLWKPRQKPIMTAADARTLRRAAALTKKVDRVAKMANSVTGKAPLRRVRGKR